jgi:16S rRNA processing protein RimM
VAGPSSDDWLAGGRVGRPHGLDGSFHVLEPRPALLRLGVVVRAGGREAEIVRRAGTDDRPILRLGGVDSREAAGELGGAELLVAREAAPALEEDEWWARDLEGCRVVDGERQLGFVERLVPLPSCEALEVTGPGDEESFLVPLVRDAVRHVDVAAKVIDVDVAFLGDTAPPSARAAAPASSSDVAPAARASSSDVSAAAPAASSDVPGAAAASSSDAPVREAR